MAADPLDDLDSRLRVLLVEDDAVIRATLERVIDQSGLAFVTAEDVAGARAVIAASRVDAAIVDVHLPDGDGLDLVRELLQLPAPCASVALTADIDEATARRAIGVGVTQFLRKPATAHQIQHAVSLAVHRSRLFRSWLEGEARGPGDDEPSTTSHRPKPRASTYRVSVAAELASEAIEIATEGLPKGTRVTDQRAERDPDLDRWLVTLRFVKG